MLGGSTLGIGVTMFLRDQFSGPAARIRGSAARMQQDLLKMQEAQLRHQRNMYAALAFGGVMAIRGLGRMVKKAAQFSYEMEFVKSITAATAEEQKRLANVAKTLGRRTMFYPQAIAEGMRFMAMAGMSAAEVEQNIRGAVALAGATKSELGGKGGAADIMTNVMKQFQIGFQYTNDVANVLSYAVTRANTNLFDLGDALKYSGATAMDINVSLEESVAMIMALGNAGMQGSMAGVAMENSMRYMARAFSSFASGPSRRALAELGLNVKDVTDQAGNLLTMTQIMKTFGNAIAKIPSNVERQAILQSTFGVRGKRAASLFLRNLQEFEKFSGDVATKSGGHAARIMEDMMNTLQGHMFKLGSAWNAMWVSFTENVGPILIFIMKGLTKTLAFFEKVFDTKILGGFFAAGIAGFIVWKTAVFAYKAAVAGLRLMHMTVGTSAAGMSATTVTGYNQMTAAAMRYNAAARMGAVTQIGQLARGASVGLIGRTAGGRLVRTGGGMGKAGRFVSKKAAGRYLGMYGARLGAGVGGRTLVSGLLGRIVGIFGGPLGLALSFVLPGLIGAVISAVKGSKKSVEENSAELKKNRLKEVERMQQFSRMGHAVRFFDLIAPPIRVEGTTGPEGVTVRPTGGATLREIGTSVMGKTTEPNIMININLDGETIFSKQLEDFFQKKVDYANNLINVP